MTHRNMTRLRPAQDVRPVTEFRANASAFLDQIRSTKCAVILTQHGRSAAVLLDMAVYEDLLASWRSCVNPSAPRPAGHPRFRSRRRPQIAGPSLPLEPPQVRTPTP